MARLHPTGLETITYGQQGWNAIVTANMQRLNTWLGKVLPLVDTSSKPDGAVAVWNQSAQTWKASAVIEEQAATISALRQDMETLQERVTVLEGKHLS